MTRRYPNVLTERELELGPASGEPISTQKEMDHWLLVRDDNDVAWLLMDKKDTSTNVLSAEVLEELNDAVAKLEQNPPKGLVLRSAKPSGFCAGADIEQFRNIEDEAAVKNRLREGHGVVDRLEALTIPKIAVIHGNCLGGGLEVALACDTRIAVHGATLGFPEVMLGLHPGLGGTFRLTGLINPAEAMTMMLTGKDAHTGKAKKLGLVDEVVEERHVANALRAALEGQLKPSEQGLKEKALNTVAARKFAASKMRAMTEKKAPSQHYPAPYALIDLWEEHGGNPNKMQEGEIESFAKLLLTDTAQNLIRVFFLQQRLKNLSESDREFDHVHVIGAGAMGGDIAAWCALRGIKASVSDVELGPLAKAVKDAEKLCKDKHRDSLETRDILDRMIPDPDNYGVEQADLIIEAVPEKIDLKEKIYKSVEPRMKEGAILATNTSSIPLDELATTLERPERFVGLHFFNPVSQMQIVEVIRHDKTDTATLDAAAAFVEQIKKLPVPLKSAPGFLVNRALMPYLLEAMLMLDEGIAKESIDKASENFGFPMGPVELADQVGLDICLDVAQVLKDSLEKPMPDIPDWVQEKVDKGEAGRKSGQGFYKWERGKAQKNNNSEAAPKDTTDRLILPLLDACIECYRLGVVDDLDIVDGAMIFATGFAPFRGGPIHYAKSRGVDDVTNTLENLAEGHGPRFEPDAGWDSLKDAKTE